MSRSEIFTKIESQFIGCSQAELTQKTKAAFSDLIGVLNEKFPKNTVFVALVVCAKLGVAQHGSISDAEKNLANATFGFIPNKGMDTLYETIASEIDEDDYEVPKIFAGMGKYVAIPALCLTLGFAYVDGMVNPAVLDKLDEIYSPCFK